MLFETVPFLSYLNFSYAAKPDENCEDPADVLAIQQAIENMGDFKLKTDKDYSVPEHLRTSADKKRADLVTLEGQVATGASYCCTLLAHSVL